ncbi:hypothetical protein ACFORG_18835 [Lutimaribacter marinistellae]|uniref:Uncharacterized protein n=1 Tax=Lutimaribacter marinistellae TaxID=1820329 RepID=A0ABV7TJN8_9RHOB
MRMPAIIAFMLTPLPGLAGYASSYEVYPVSPESFEVVTTKGPAAGDYWCGAGQFTIAQLGRSSTQDIYVVRGRGASSSAPGETSVLFSFQPPAGGEVESLSNSVDLIGNALSAAQAQAYCFDRTIKD